MLRHNPLGLDGVMEILPDQFGDHRGFFSESFHQAKFEAAGVTAGFVQDNHSYSASKGVLRGLHYQLEPFAQDKLVRVVSGAIFDVAVDIRRGSKTFGKWISLVVSRHKWNQIFVPKGFAHGFVTLEDHTEVVYKVSSLYSPAHDRSIRYDDIDIGIEWPRGLGDFQLSDKDKNGQKFADAELFE
jgi:dTDP-4-dehydrorhamnose 3,5-epimerase